MFPAVIYEFGAFTVDDEFFELRHNGQLVALEKRVFDLLLHLVRHRDRLVSQEELLQVIWDGRKVSRASLSVAMTAARRAIRESIHTPPIIVTHRGRGYRFTAEIVEKQSTKPHAPGPSLSQSLLDTGALVGRDEACRAIESLLEKTSRGFVQLALISGEAGIGKTRLLQEAASRAAGRGFNVALGRCPNEPGAPPLWPWIEILRGLTVDTSIPESRRADPRVLEMYRVIPGLSQLDAALPAPNFEDSKRARFRVNHCIATALEVLASPIPLLISLDDLHQADQASLDLLAYISGSISPANLLIVAAYRDATTSARPAFTRTLGSLVRSPCAHPIELHGLSPEAARSLIETLTGSTPSGPLLREILKRSDGNPFFIRHLVLTARNLGRASDSQISPHVTDDLMAAISQSLEELPEQTRELLSIAAIIGSEFSVGLLAQLAERDPTETLCGLQPAIDARHLAEDDHAGRYRFSHSLVRDSLYRQIQSLRRSTLHRRCGDLLAQGFHEGASYLLPTLAYHYSEAASVGTAREASKYSLAAANWAATRSSYAEAAELYARTIELLDLSGETTGHRRCELLLQLGTQHLCSGNRVEARRVFESAASLARDTGAKEALAETALSLAPGVLSIETGVVDRDLIALLEAALRNSNELSPAMEAKLKARLSVALHWADDQQRTKDLVNSAMGLAMESGDARALLFARHAHWFACHGPSREVSRLDLARDLVRNAIEVDDANMELICRLFVIGALLERGSMATFDAEVAHYASLAEHLRQPQSLWYVPMLRGARALMEGRLSEASSLRDSFSAMGARVGDANAYHSAMAHSLLILHENDRARDALPLVNDAVDKYPTVPGWRATRAWILASIGSVSAARRDIAFLIEQSREGMAERLDWMATTALLAESVAIVGDIGQATFLYETLTPLAERFFVVGLCVASWGSVSRNLGLLAKACKNWSAARHHLEDAVRYNRAAGATVWEIQATLDLARHYAHSPIDQDMELARNLSTAAKLGATDLQLPRLDREATELLERLK